MAKMMKTEEGAKMVELKIGGGGISQ